MWQYVYILRSKKDKSIIYTGITRNLSKRLDKHNEGGNISTKRSIPWYIETCIAFRNEEKARAYEKYLKSGSGKAFLKKRLI
jgi:predicted GIY-YIG superfamily endonuclease